MGGLQGEGRAGFRPRLGLTGWVVSYLQITDDDACLEAVCTVFSARTCADKGS